MLTRLLYGGRVSLSMGLAPVVLATGIGGALGIIAGYFGRHVNMLIMRVIDVFYAFPSVLLAVAMAGVLGAALRQIAALFARLDMAVRIHDARGLARPAAPFEPAGVDAYALVEALFWDRLTDEAEQLLKVQLAVELV